MAKGYLIAFYRAAHDQDKLAAYAALAGPAMAANGGKLLARGNPAGVTISADRGSKKPNIA